MNLRKRILDRLLRKPVPKSYSISAPTKEQLHYDWISVHGATKTHSYVLLRARDKNTDRITYWWWDSEESTSTAKEGECAYWEVEWDSLRASHRFRTWDITYGSLAEAYLQDLLRLPVAKWHIQRIRSKFIRRVAPNFQIRLLQVLLDLHQKNAKIYLWDLVARIYGGAVRLSDQNYAYYKQLEFLIDSLVESGNAKRKTPENSIDFIGCGDVVPTPKAITTLAAHDWERRKLNASVWLGRCQLLLGLGMLALAAATLYLRLPE